MRIVRPLFQTVGDIPKRVRDLNRLREVVQVLVRHGFGMLVAGIELPGLPRVEADHIEGTPARAKSAMQALGPTFVKLGQVLSTRPDVLPDEYCEAFQGLQDDAGTMPMEAVDKVLARSLGAGWRERFGSFDEDPLATASIAQVHCATLHDGTEVVLKVQRPGLRRKIAADLAILRFLALRILAEFPEAQSFDPEGILDEFERSIDAELDFVQEAKNQNRVARLFEGDPRVKVPTVYDDLSTDQVLCMARLHGVKIRDAREAGCDMAVVGERYLTLAYDMLFVHGYFHGDLHPGNVLVLPGEVIGLLDFGMMGQLTQDLRADVIFIIFAVQRGDFRTLARLLYDIAIKTRRIDYRELERDTIEVVQRHWSGGSVADMQLGPFFVELATKAAKHGARIPSDYTMFFKALVTSEGLAKSLISEIDPLKAAEPYVMAMLKERLEPARWTDELSYQALTLGSLARRLPVSLAQLLDDVDAQRLHLNVQQIPSLEAEERKDRRMNRLLATVGAVGCAGCGTLALAADAGWIWFVPIVALTFWTLAALLGLAALWMVVRNRG